MIKERLSVYMSNTLGEYSRIVAVESTNMKERTHNMYSASFEPKPRYRFL